MDFVWYSNASDETGKALAEDLGFESGKKTPKFSEISTLVCWGAKGGTKYDPENLNMAVASGALRVLNHPGIIEQNKDKLWMLQRMRERGVPVPEFMAIGAMSSSTVLSTIKNSMGAGKMDFPLLLMNRFNKGQPSFVHTVAELEHCITTLGQKMSEIEIVRCYTHGTDYRLHVFRDSVIWSQKSQVAKDPAASLAISFQKKLLRRAKKAEVAITAPKAELDFIVRELAEDLLCGPHQFQRTVGRGLELVDTNTNKLPENMVVAAIQALDAVELDMGAVNLSYDDGTVLVTNVISYPGLDEKQRKAYVKAIKAFSKESKPRDKEIPKETGEKKASTALVAKLTRRIKRMSTTQAAKMLEDLGE